MKNWAGQDIQVGDTVWRGARLRNGSEFKIGIVEVLNEEKETAKVHWQFEHGYRYEHKLGVNFRNVPIAIDTHGTSTIHSLCKIDPESLFTE